MSRPLTDKNISTVRLFTYERLVSSMQGQLTAVVGPVGSGKVYDRFYFIVESCLGTGSEHWRCMRVRLFVFVLPDIVTANHSGMSPTHPW